MSRRKTIVVDMDSTCVEMLGRWLADYNRLTGDNLRVEELTTFHTHDHARHGRRVYEPLMRPGFFLDLPAMPGALEAMEVLSRECDVFVASSPMHASHADDKRAWISEYLSFVPRENVAFTDYKKEDLPRADVLIDDGPHVVEAYRSRHPEAFIAGIEHPYNKSARGVYDVLAADWRDPGRAWDEILDKVLAHLGRLP